LNQPPIQFALRLESPIQNLYNDTSSSHVGDEGNDIEVGMDDLLHDIQAIEGILLHVFWKNELGGDVDVVDTFFESLKSASTTPFFGRRGSRYTQLRTTILMYNLK
jgi:hypothetical protein